MTIDEVIEKNYNSLLEMMKDRYKVVSESKTDEDYLQDICLQALRKFKRKDIEEEEGFDYLRKNLLMELKFKYSRKGQEIITYTDSLPDIPDK